MNLNRLSWADGPLIGVTAGSVGPQGLRASRLTPATERCLGTGSADHGLGRSGAAVVGNARYSITANNEAVEAGAGHVAAWARNGRRGPMAVLIDGGLD